MKTISIPYGCLIAIIVPYGTIFVFQKLLSLSNIQISSFDRKLLNQSRMILAALTYLCILLLMVLRYNPSLSLSLSGCVCACAHTHRT